MALEMKDSFCAMNTEISTILKWPEGSEPDLPACHQLIRRWFHDVEARFSRFLPTSELSSLNRSAGSWQLVSPMMTEVLSLALNYCRQTEGAFHPALLRQLQREGYHSSFEHAAAFRPSLANRSEDIRTEEPISVESRAADNAATSYRDPWLAIHMLAYPIFAGALFHGLLSGTDSSLFVIKLMYILTGTATLLLLLGRFLIRQRSGGQTRVLPGADSAGGSR